MAEVSYSLAIVLGAIGAAIPDVIKAVRLRYRGRPAYLSTSWFYLMLLMLMALGGLVVALRHPADALEAVAFGMAAPAFLTKLIASDEEESLSESAPSPFMRMRKWWA